MLKFNNNEINSIMFNGKAVDVVRFNGSIVWQVQSNVAVSVTDKTLKIIGTGFSVSGTTMSFDIPFGVTDKTLKFNI